MPNDSNNVRALPGASNRGPRRRYLYVGHLTTDLGFDHIIRGQDFQGRTRLSCRVYGINAPELSTDAGKASAAYAKGLLPVGSLVKLISHGWDKYGGRYDGDITLPNGDDFGIAMILAGMAVKI